MPPNRALWIVVGGAFGVLSLAAIVSVQRIPEGRVGLDGTTVRQASWVLHRPFAPLLVLRTPDDVAVPAVRWKSKEGSTLEFALDLSYTLSRPLAPQLVAETDRLGWDGAIGAMAEHVLADVGGRVDTETLLSNPERTETPLRAALEAAGVHVVRLSLRSRVGDEVVRRTSTEQARRLARLPGARILVIGWDGADWDTARPLMTEGRMPNLARLVREGASAPLRSYDPMFSPLLWTTVATGKPPTEHGIADFLVRDAGSQERRPITSDFRRVKALWNILSDFGRPSSWIGWWASFPAEAVRGLLVSDYLGAALASKSADEAAALPGVVNPPGGLHHPSELLVTRAQITREDVARIIPVSESEFQRAQEEIARAPEKRAKDKAQPTNPVTLVIHVLSATRSYQNIAMAQLKTGSPFVAVYFEGIDVMGHGFQHDLPPKMSIVSEADFERYRDAVPRFYEYQDELLGELLRAAGPDAVTVLLSDHGFRTGADRPDFPPSTKGQPEEWHRDWGILALHGAGIRPGPIAAASIYDVTPTLLYLSGLPLADDMPGRMLAAAFDPATLRQFPPKHLRSYELVGSRLEHASDAAADPAAMREMMANLRALGYVGGAADEPGPQTTSAAQEPGSTETQYFFHRNLAVLYIRQGRYADAEAELLAANERSSRGKTFEMLSQVRASLGRYPEAIATLEDGWKTVPDQMNPSSLLWIIDLHLLKGDQGGARKALQAWSTRMTPAIRLAADGRLRDTSGDVAGATRAYRDALSADPLMVSIAQRLLELEGARGDVSGIETFLLRAVESHPKVDAYWDMAGQLALSRGDYGSAIERFRRANALQPDDGVYLGHVASALAASGRTDEARTYLAWAERFPPTEPGAWMALGGAWDRVGDTDRAVQAFAAAKTAGYKGPGADLGAALALARVGRSAEALRVISDAETRFPSSKALSDLKVRLTR